MLDKMKDIGNQALVLTGDAIGAVTNTVSSGVDSLNEKAVRASTAQMYRILEIALEELKGRPLAQQPLSLTSSINVGVASLELQIHLNNEAGPAQETTSEQI
ncbi:hypothetical protein D0C16_21500 [Cellvibrio sp. KY-GH-1]|uniref:hypothetical protein n=1 Tax=Cellvibrio sp. KY-GH-1 TaxID=2303332 RepID=UPI0012486FEC|nr:hypothetical protein [Cellvibrio sp. KY-GH-1]QEY18336.1 hypothetical protein D0C16_21500 [Cellvibrio sp. KY-GH-1]